MPNLRILVSLLDEHQEYQRLQADEARSTAARVDVEVVFCRTDPQLQLQQVREALAAEVGRRPGAVVLQPIATAGLESLARAAVQAGVGWIALDPGFYLDILQREFPGKLAALVTTDNREVGRLQARLFRALLPRGGRVIYVEGPSLSPPVMHRREGVMEGLVGSRVTIVKTLTGDWNEASAEKIMSFWLRVGGKDTRPDLVGAQNDLMAAGARRAVLALRPDWRDVLFTGCDGLPEGGLKLVREKVLAGTVVQPRTAGPSIELAARALRGEKVPPTTFLAPRVFPAIEELERAAGA